MNNDYKNIIEKLLWGVILLLLMIPIIQQRYQYWLVEPLNGAIKEINNPDFITKKYLKGNFQKEKETYINQQFGFRNDLVRMKNQLDYELYNKANARNVIVGKEDYLYEEPYIKSYMGLNFIGQKTIKEKVRKLGKIRDTLQKANTDIVMIFAPGKASFFPEYIPDHYYKKQKKQTNLQAYKDAYDERGILYMDLNQYFVSLKETSPYPLYPKLGIHWSEYGQYVAIDTIIRFVENLKQIQLPQIVLDSVVLSQANNRGEEVDIGDGMNLWNDLSTYPLADPIIHYEKTENTTQPLALVIADSYYWGLYRHRLSKEVFNKGDFWFYNQEIFPAAKGGAKKCKNVNIIPELEKQDIVFIMNTEGTLKDVGFKFIERVYDAYYKNPPKGGKDLEYFVNKIKNNPDWLGKITIKAKKFNLTTEEMIQKDAKFMFKQHQMKKK